MTALEKEQKLQEIIESNLDKAIECIEVADEIVCDKLNESEYASESFKQYKFITCQIYVKNRLLAQYKIQ